MALQKLKPVTWPADAGWLVPGYNCTPLGYAVVLRALKDVGILEVPLGTNRGTRIDAMTKRAGLSVSNNPKTPGYWWCAIYVGAVWADCNALVPEQYPAVDAWLPYLRKDADGKISKQPVVGDAIIYGLRKSDGRMDGQHIGIVARITPMVLSIEGNRSFAGTTNNGVAVDLGPVIRRDILGYVSPRLA